MKTTHSQDWIAGATCPDPARHNLHTDGRWLFERCPACGGAEPITANDLRARGDAQHDFLTATVDRDVPADRCTGCGAQAKLFSYGRERLCIGCMDVQLDLVAKAAEEIIDLVPQADGSWAVAR